MRTAFANKMKRIWIFLFLFILILTGCHPSSQLVESNITYFTPQSLIDTLPSPFKPLDQEEQLQDWGKELRLGQFFAREMDFYRAITCFKSALFLIPPTCFKRQLEIEYLIVESYYLGGKYCEAIDFFEASSLMEAPPDFSAFHDLVILLFDAYLRTSQPEKAFRLLNSIGESDEALAQDLALQASVCYADFTALNQMVESYPEKESLSEFLADYHHCAKSVTKAQTLNAILPGAGYYYVGQKKSAFTSFVINTLFAAAAYQFFDHGYLAAGLITLSFEMGWYFGGINGAGLAAKEYNQHLYENLGKEFLIKNQLFPVLMFHKSF